MKNLIRFFLPIFVLALVTACNNSPKGEKVETAPAKKATPKAAKSASIYNVDTAKSSINWTGSKPTGTHQGTLKISKGVMAVQAGHIASGSFGLDMNSIAVTDLKAGEGKEDLEGHLKTGDFFETEKFPAGSFTITKVTTVSGDTNKTHDIEGNLNLKGISKSITIPANIAINGNVMTAVTPAFKINRTEWGINFHSGIIGTAKDKLINDEISLVLNLIATAN